MENKTQKTGADVNDLLSTMEDAQKRTLTLGGEVREEALTNLVRHSTDKACLYMRRLDDIDREVLATLIDEAVKSA